MCFKQGYSKRPKKAIGIAARSFLIHNKKAEINGDSILSVKMSILGENEITNTC